MSSDLLPDQLSEPSWFSLTHVSVQLKSAVPQCGQCLSPLKQQLDEGAGGGEGPVGGEEDTNKVGLPVLRVQQVGDQALQGGGLQPAHLHRVVLGEAEGCRGLCHV